MLKRYAVNDIIRLLKLFVATKFVLSVIHPITFEKRNAIV